MKTIRIALFLLLAALLTMVIVVACSTSQRPTPSSTFAVEDDDNGPPTPPNEQSSMFTFDKESAFVERIVQKTFGPEGGTIEFNLDGLSRAITFPDRPFLSSWDVTVTAQKGFNPDGEVLEIYIFEPVNISKIGDISLVMESAFAAQTDNSQGIVYSLYSEYAGEYTQFDATIPDDRSEVSFVLSNSDKWAVVYDGVDFDDDINLK